MKRHTLTALFGVAILSGCAHGPTGLARPAHMPNLPAELVSPATRLAPITDDSLKGAIINGATDDQRYNALAHRFNSMLGLWGCVAKAMEDRRDVDSCLK